LKDDFPNILQMRSTLNAINSMYGNSNKIGLKEAWPHFKGELLKKMKSKQLISVFEKEHYYKSKLLHSTFYGIMPTLLRNYDKYSMYAGVEVRMPFLDYRIIEFAFTLPNSFKLRNGFSKAIIRNAAKPIVPASILSNKIKTGWNSPMGEWFAGVWKQWLLDEISSSTFQNCTLIDTAAFRKKVNEFYAASNPDHNMGQELWLRMQPYLIEKANKRFSKI
jgi:asparagine synthase (glutamine-hydrolysing)